MPIAPILLIARSDFTADALADWIPILYPDALQTTDRNSVRRVVIDQFFDGLAIYENLADEIQQALDSIDATAGSQNFDILVDSIAPNEMHLVTEVAGWSNIVSLLIVTFPEVRWLFGAIHGAPLEFPRDDHVLRAGLSARRDPMFDPTGLRNWIRIRTNLELDIGKSGLRLPVRAQAAASIDDETGYCRFCGYTAYRFGYRTDIVTNWKLMRSLFASSGDRVGSESMSHGYRVLLEDMSLNFPDKPGDAHILMLDKRGAILPLLDSCNIHEDAAIRALVTSGHGHDDQNALASNRTYLRNKRVGIGHVVMKPTGGMIDLWERIGQLGGGRDGERRGNASDFQWPSIADTSGSMRGHGAPGKLILIGERLLRRAECIRRGTSTLSHCLLGGVIAMDAAELIGGRAPALALSALAYKHEFEVKAECAFVGSGFHFEIARRIGEIEIESRASCATYSDGPRELAEMNAAALVLNRLAIAFRGEGKFEEETQCLVALRSTNRRLQYKQRPGLLDRASGAVLGYAEWLLSSFLRLASVSIGLLVGFTLVWLAIDFRLNDKFTPVNAVALTFSAFFGGNAVESEWPLTIWSCLAVVTGAFHVGVLISFIYSLISRK